jgi:hypothetical protein
VQPFNNSLRRQLGPIASLFESKKDRIDYSKFCEALDIFSRTGRLTSSLRLKEENANQLIIHTDKKRTRLVRRESSRSLQRRASWHKSDENSAEQSESDFTMRTIRMDPRLETQRILRVRCLPFIHLITGLESFHSKAFEENSRKV